MESAYANSIFSRELVGTPDRFPVKLYTFSGAMDAFQNGSDIRQSLLGVLKENPELTQPGQTSDRYALAAAWNMTLNDRPYKMLDIASYYFDKSWTECNPEVQWRFFRNGERFDGTTCETFSIIVGEEGKLRRRTSNLEEYVSM